jgi:hypothetical protein
MKLFTIEVKLSEQDRSLIRTLTEVISMLKDDLAAAGASLVASVDGLAERLANQTQFIGTVADADVVTSIQLQQAQASRIQALAQPPAPAAAPAAPVAPAA